MPGEGAVRLPGIVLFVLVAAAYAGGYELATNWFSTAGQGASFFPAAGVTLAALVLVARRQWPVVLAAAAAAELSLDLARDMGALTSLGYTLANVAEPLVGALLLTAAVARIDLRRTRDLAAFLTCAVIFAPVVGGTIAATTFVFVDGQSGWARFAFEWWAGDGLGVLVVGGALLSLRTARDLPARRIVEGVLLGVLALVAALAVFELGRFAFVYVPVAVLLVLAFRVGTAGVAVTSALIAFSAAGATADAKEFWQSVDISPANRILYLQLALGVIIAAMLALAAEIAERERIAVELARTESERAAALERAGLAESEARARIHAESLGRSAALLARSANAGQVADAVVSVVSDWGANQAAFFAVEGDRLVLLAAVSVDDDVWNECLWLPVELDAPSPEAVRRAAPIVLRNYTEFELRYPEFADSRRRHAFQTLASFPIVTDGSVKAVLNVTIAEADWVTEDRSALISALADQAAVALERASLLERERDAAEDTALLARLGEALERATGTAERAEALVSALAADRAAFAVVHSLDELDRPQLLAESPNRPAVEDSALVALASAAVSAQAAATGEAGGLELLAVPLRARGRALGVLTIGVGAGGDSRMTPALLQRIATHAALALDNARLYEQERDVSHSLQMGLLGGNLASTKAAAIATAYRPGTATLEVGGDWYDAFLLPSGRLALLVGDVVGHGLEAALAMGQLRGAVRALAPVGPPREVLERLDRFVETLPEAAMATLAYAELDLEDGRMTYACAGHPPPLLVPADGEPRLLWDGRSAPLGAVMNATREEATGRLAPGDTILLYTDGLVERRTAGLSAGLDLLVEVAGQTTDGAPANLVERILDVVLEGQPQDDDVCILAVRRAVAEARFTHSFPAAPAEVAGMRRALASWLEGVELSPARRQDAVLAVSEAAVNAAEHAYDFDGSGLVLVEAWVADDELQLSVQDTGTWREPGFDTDRGRGRTMMRALMRIVTIDHGREGTTVRMSLPMRQEVPA